jgi:hypothetical protein
VVLFLVISTPEREHRGVEQQHRRHVRHDESRQFVAAHHTTPCLGNLDVTYVGDDYEALLSERCRYPAVTGLFVN